MVGQLSRLLTALIVVQFLFSLPGAAQDREQRFVAPPRIDPDEPRKRPQRPPRQQIAAPPDVDSPPLDAGVTASGVIHKLIEAGTGEEPVRINDTITLHFTGWTTDGTMFDTTEFDGEPVRYTTSRMLRGLTEGLLEMVEGETRRLWIPQELAFDGQPDQPRGMVVFDVRLVSIEERGLLPPPDVVGIPEGAVILDSGLAYRILEPGTGDERPAGDDAVRVHFTAFYTDGRLIDDTRQREAVSFTLDNTIPAYREVLPLMVRGEKRRLWAPEEMANLNDPPTYEGMLVFDVELLDFRSKPEVPPDVSGIPPDAEQTETGLAYKVLRTGTGDRHPRPNDTVVVDYAGWTRDGKRFDSSYDHGVPGTFKLDHRKPLGWNQALQMMVVGEKRRIWVPEELSYAQVEGRPQGMLVFEVELLGIEE
jgi:FKBP-type peptidyl-prolyl cis-trans isomerase